MRRILKRNTSVLFIGIVAVTFFLYVRSPANHLVANNIVGIVYMAEIEQSGAFVSATSQTTSNKKDSIVWPTENDGYYKIILGDTQASYWDVVAVKGEASGSETVWYPQGNHEIEQDIELDPLE